MTNAEMGMAEIIKVWPWLADFLFHLKVFSENFVRWDHYTFLCRKIMTSTA